MAKKSTTPVLTSSVVARATVQEFKAMNKVKQLLIMRGDITDKLCVQTPAHTTIATVATTYDADLPSAFIQVSGEDGKLFWCLCNCKPTQTYTLEATL